MDIERDARRERELERQNIACRKYRAREGGEEEEGEMMGLAKV